MCDEEYFEGPFIQVKTTTNDLNSGYERRYDTPDPPGKIVCRFVTTYTFEIERPILNRMLLVGFRKKNIGG